MNETAEFSSAPDYRQTTGQHMIDLACIYGDDKKTQERLREGKGGRLKSQIIGGDEYPVYASEVTGALPIISDILSIDKNAFEMVIAPPLTQ